MTRSEPIITLPGTRLIGCALVCCGAAAVLWMGGMMLAGQPRPTVMAGLVAGGLVAACSVAGIMGNLPWIPKPASTAMLLWLASSAVRLVMTSIALFLLYSAAPAGGPALLLATATIYLATLLGEIALIARHVHRTEAAAKSHAASAAKPPEP